MQERTEAGQNIYLTWPEIHSMRILLTELEKVARTSGGEMEVVKGCSVKWGLQGATLSLPKIPL